MPTAPAPRVQQIYDSKSGRMRLADPTTGALAEVATAENLLPLINRLLVIAGAEPLPDDTTADNMLPLLTDTVQHAEEMHAGTAQAAASDDVQAMAAVGSLRRLCGLPLAPMATKLASQLVSVVKVIEAIPVVQSRGRMIVLRDKLR